MHACYYDHTCMITHEISWIDIADYDWYECSWRKPAELRFVVFFLEVTHCTPTINSSQMRSVSSSLSVEASIIRLPCQGLRSAKKDIFTPIFQSFCGILCLAEHDHQKLTGSTSLTALVVFGLCQWQQKKSDNLTKQADIKMYTSIQGFFFHASSSSFLDASGKPKLTEVAIIHSWLALELAVAYMRLAGCGWPTDSMSANWNSMIQRKQRYWFHASEATLLDEADSLK